MVSASYSHSRTALWKQGKRDLSPGTIYRTRLWFVISRSVTGIIDVVRPKENSSTGTEASRCRAQGWDAVTAPAIVSRRRPYAAEKLAVYFDNEATIKSSGPRYF